MRVGVVVCLECVVQHDDPRLNSSACSVPRRRTLRTVKAPVLFVSHANNSSCLLDCSDNVANVVYINQAPSCDRRCQIQYSDRLQALPRDLHDFD